MHDRAAASRPAPGGQQWSEAELDTRRQLAACYRALSRYGMTDLIFNHISARIPGTDEILINAYGLLYTEVSASNLYKITLDGDVLWEPENRLGINPGGYVIHSAVHKARHDVACVIHTHTRAGMAVSAMKCGLLPLTQTAMRFHNRIGFHDYEGIATREEECERIARDLGPHDAMILRNHGLLACGKTIGHAFGNLYALENACKAQVDLLSTGADPFYPPEETWETTAQAWARTSDSREPLAWAAVIRQLDREDPGYAD